MTKLVIQIPCFNEADHLPETLAALPRKIDGVDEIEVLVIDDGSHDGTATVARKWGAHYVVAHRRNRGLAAAFTTGKDAALRAGADIIVNTDADGQYVGEDIAKLVAPVVEGRADIVIGDRSVAENEHFHPFKRRLQKFGSSIVRKLSRTHVTDAVSGFRAMSREAAQSITITTEFSYTTDMLIQSGRKRLNVLSVPIRTNPAARPSRLFRSIPQFIINTGITIARAYTTYNPLRVFVVAGGFCALMGAIPIVRFIYFWLAGESGGHIQSLVIGGALLVLGVVTVLMGILADLIGANRKLLEAGLMRMHQLEDRLDRIEKANSQAADEKPEGEEAERSKKAAG